MSFTFSVAAQPDAELTWEHLLEEVDLSALRCEETLELTGPFPRKGFDIADRASRRLGGRSRPRTARPSMPTTVLGSPSR